MVHALVRLYKKHWLFEQITVLLVGTLGAVSFGLCLYTFFDFFGRLMVMTH